MTITLAQYYSISPSDVELIAVDFTDTLSTTETLTTPTATQIGTTVLTLASVAVNTGSTEVLGRTVSVGKAVSFRVSGQTLSNAYRVRVQVVTTSIPTRTLNRDVLFDCQ